MSSLFALAALLLAQVQPVPAIPPQDNPAINAPPGSGEALYMARCAGCHGAVADAEAQARAGPTRVPAKIVIEKYPKEHIVEALIYGPMVQMAVGLSDADIDKIASYLTAGQKKP